MKNGRYSDELIMAILKQAEGGVPESEIWADVRVVQASYRRGNSYSTVRVRMTSADAISEFKDAMTADPRLNASVQAESEFYAEQSRFFAVFVTTIGIFVGALMGLGAIFGAINTMYAAVSSRAPEIGVLLCLGFKPRSVLTSFLLEAVLIALLGGALGCLIALPINGLVTSTTNWNSFSEVAFAFRITPRLLLNGMIFSVVMGLVGGYFPARRAAKQQVVDALRQV